MTYRGYFSCYDLTTRKITKLNGGLKVMDYGFVFEYDGLVVLDQVIFYVSWLLIYATDTCHNILLYKNYSQASL